MQELMKKSYSNKEIAQLLRSVAAAYTVKNEQKYRFQIIAYERAADSIELSSNEVKDLWDEGKLTSLAGIGSSISGYLDELFSTGEVKHFKSVLAKLPKAMFSLLDIPGIGPKSAFKLATELKIMKKDRAVESLKKAALEGKIKKIEGFGEDSENKIIKAINDFQSRGDRLLLYQAEVIAQTIIEYLKKCSAVIEVYPLGSLRRQVSTVGDIDLAVSTKNRKKVVDWFLGFPQKKRALEAGLNTASLLLIGGRRIDLKIQPPESFGALLQHFTGSKHHNIKLREIALDKGYSLSEYGIKNKKKNNALKKFSNETDFYNYLGMDWIPPELREDSGEIEKASEFNDDGSSRLPKLIELKDLKGDLHLHSNFSIEPSHDLGESSLEELVAKASSLNYEYIALTEHNPSISNHNDKDIYNLIKRKKAFIEQFNISRVNKIPLKIFNSLEIDIKPNGELAIPERCLDLLDFAIVSIHSVFNLEKKEMTERIIRALDHPKVKIFGHPTGRKLNSREGYEIDWERLFDFCLKKNKFLEISGWPERLDLPDFLVREAVNYGVKMAINSDSHLVDQMDLIRYGISVARRGWAEKKYIINTLNLKEISDILVK